MSQDDWNKPKNDDPWDAESNDWYSEKAEDPKLGPHMPQEGEGWGPQHEPQPLHPEQSQYLGQPPGHSVANMPREQVQPGQHPPGQPQPGQPHYPGQAGPQPLFNNPAQPYNQGQNPYGPGQQPQQYSPNQIPFPHQQQPPQTNYPMQPYQGQAMQPYKSSNELNTEDMLALAMTFVLPGTGHMIAGQPMKGLATIFCFFFSCGLGYMIVPLLMYDVYLVSKARKKRAVGEWEMLPKS